MKKRKFLQTVFAAVLGAAVLSACGKSAEYDSGAVAYDTAASTSSYDAGNDYLISNGVAAFNEMAEAELAEEYDVAEPENGVTKGQQNALEGRKLIKTVNLSVETEQFDDFVPALEQQVTSLGGYIEDMSSYNRSNHYSADYIGTKYLRYANMTIRIPKENLDSFLSTVSEKSNVVGRSESVTDVTLQYVDLESHKKALVAEQDRLLELIGKAETVEDIITIEGRLSEVRYQLETMESQLRTYDNKIDYSTVYLSIDEVEQYTPTDETTVGQRISSGFMDSLRGVGRGISNFAIWFVISLPYIIVWAVIIVAVILIVRVVLKTTAKRRAKRKLQKVNPYQSQNAQPLSPYALTGMQPDVQKSQELQQPSSTDVKRTEDNPTES